MSALWLYAYFNDYIDIKATHEGICRVPFPGQRSHKSFEFSSVSDPWLVAYACGRQPIESVSDVEIKALFSFAIGADVVSW